MNETRFLSIIYTFFLGLLLSVFVGFGIATFYPSPEPPVYRDTGFVEFPEEPDERDKERQRQEAEEAQEYNQAYDKYQSELADYNQAVSIIALVAAVGLVAASLVFNNRLKVIADGVLLGGLFTLIYSVGRSFAAANATHSFITLSIALIIVLYLGYIRFIKTAKDK